MEETKKKLKALESNWMEILFNQLKLYFSKIRLPSHDHWHHFRVWQFTKLILYHLEKNEIYYNSNEIKNLMLASLFHDVGLTQTLDESHGKAGADICRKFINSDKLNLTTDFSSALEAIEKHDDKKYIKTETFEHKPTILNILSTADDLDAFGNIGIIRYAEIYMLRNTSIEEISDKVIKNAEQRLQHFSNKFGYFKELVDQQKKRYEELVNFYKSVNASTNQHWNILLHIQNNIKSPQNNKNLTDLLAPVDSQHIKDFKSKVEQEEQQFLEYSQIGFL